MSDTLQLGLESFFDNLVGDVSRTNEYIERLSQEFDQVTAYEDPYLKLYVSGRNIIDETVDDLINQGLVDDEMGVNIRKIAIASSLHTNARTGVGITICGLRAVGDVYEREAASPQPKNKVEQNVGRVIRHMHGIAFLGNSNAQRHLKALYLGVSPISEQAQVIYGSTEGIVSRACTKQVSPDSLIVTSNSEGELDIKVKHPRFPVAGVNPCPATEVVVNDEGSNKSGLLIMMKSIAAVGIERIYPDIFKITE